MAVKLNILSRVSFAGYVAGDQKDQLLRDCTIFALPTYYRSEAMPLVLLEAMGAGKPVLAGTAGAISDIISDPDNGVLLQDITPQTIETGLRRLLNDLPAAREMGERNRAKALASFEASVVTSRIEDFYQGVAAC